MASTFKLWYTVGASVFIHLINLVTNFSTTTTATVDGYFNVALNKPTKQIDTKDNRVSSWANDGNPSGNLYVCARTSSSKDTWWVVDLLQINEIFAVRVKNRDTTSYKLLKNFYVYVSNRNPLPLPPVGGNFPGEICLFHLGSLRSRSFQYLPCEGGITLRGRYVYLWKPGDSGQLYLCEFEALTKKAPGVREFTYSLSKGEKSLAAPSHTVVLSSATVAASHLQCTVLCLNLANPSEDTVVFDKKTGTCSCYYVKPFDHNGSAGNFSFVDEVDVIELVL